jgi:hypothetical protein
MAIEKDFKTLDFSAFYFSFLAIYTYPAKEGLGGVGERSKV